MQKSKIPKSWVNIPFGTFRTPFEVMSLAMRSCGSSSTRGDRDSQSPAQPLAVASAGYSCAGLAVQCASWFDSLGIP